MAQLLKKLGSPIMTNLYYGTVKQLLERVSSVMIDAEAVEYLVGYVKDALEGGGILNELGKLSEPLTFFRIISKTRCVTSGDFSLAFRSNLHLLRVFVSSQV